MDILFHGHRRQGSSDWLDIYMVFFRIPFRWYSAPTTTKSISFFRSFSFPNYFSQLRSAGIRSPLLRSLPSPRHYCPVMLFSSVSPVITKCFFLTLLSCDLRNNCCCVIILNAWSNFSENWSTFSDGGEPKIPSGLMMGVVSELWSNRADFNEAYQLWASDVLLRISFSD